MWLLVRRERAQRRKKVNTPGRSTEFFGKAYTFRGTRESQGIIQASEDIEAPYQYVLLFAPLRMKDVKINTGE